MNTPRVLCSVAILTAAGGWAHAQSCQPSWPVRFIPVDVTAPVSVPSVVSSIVYDDGLGGPTMLYVAGSFNAIGGVAAHNFARWDGRAWSAPAGATLGTFSQFIGTHHGMAVFRPSPAGPRLLYACDTGGVHTWDDHTWTTDAPSVLVGSSYGTNEVSTWSPARLFIADPDGAGPVPQSIYAAVERIHTYRVTTNTSGFLYRLESGQWTDVGIPIGGRVTGFASFDPDGDGPQPTSLLATRIEEWDAGVALHEANSKLSRGVNGAWADVAADPDGSFESLAVFDRDGPGGQPATAFVGGLFHVGGQTTHLATLVGDALVPIAQDADGPILQLVVVDEDGAGPSPALYALGNFAHIGGVAALSVARFDGSTWAAVGPGIPGHPQTLCTFDDDGAGPRSPFLYAGGGFVTAGYAPAIGIARWDGISWLPPNRCIDNPIHTLLSADDGSGPALYIGGAFLSSDGLRTVGVSRWNGQNFSQLTTGMNSHVDALALFQNQVIAAGKFTSAGGVPCNHAARWTGSAWAALGAGLNDNVNALATFNDGPGLALFAGGKFTAAGGAAASHIARWNGQSWTPLGAGVDGEVTALASYAGRLCVGGNFAHAGVFAAYRVASWDGSTWHPLGNGPPFSVSTLAPHRGVLYAGGTSAADPSVALVSAWNGQSWFTLPPLAGPTGSTTRLTALYSFDEDGSGPGQPVLYASGDFDHSGSTTLPHLARWDGLSWSAPAQGLDAPALAFAPFGGTPAAPTLYAGGEFMVAGGATSWFLASLAGCPTTCESNCDGSAAPPILNVLDLTCFLQRFSAGDPYANCDSSTAAPILNVLDFTCFLQKFAAGCP